MPKPFPREFREDVICVARKRSGIRGSAVLEIHTGPGPTTLIEGAYWTERDTKGSLRFDAHVDQTVTHFEHAAMLFAR